MLALYRSGRQAEALEAYRSARSGLVEQIGLEPGAELRVLQDAILRQDPALEPPTRPIVEAAAADLAGATGGGRRLPRVPTPTIGRDRELREITDRVRADAIRLLTLIGPGGVGKTRLMIEVASRAAPDFAHGAYFVDLTTVADPRDLPSAVARGLGVPVRQGEPAVQAIARHFADHQALVVLDNFEHLLEGVALVADLLATCPGITIVVTSRAPSGLAAELLHPVRPLQFPSRGEQPADIERCAAVELFCERARAREPTFDLDERTAPWVGEICRRLDGLPLALELAAARIAILEPADLADRLGHALEVLVGGARDAPERQRTPRATIDWSHDLLSEDERRTFARMAVLAGGATVGMAEAVTGAALATLESLIAKQLLVRRDERLTMLETIREYASDRLGKIRAATRSTAGSRRRVSMSPARRRRILVAPVTNPRAPSSTLSCRMLLRRCPGQSRPGKRPWQSSSSRSGRHTGGGWSTGPKRPRDGRRARMRGHDRRRR